MCPRLSLWRPGKTNDYKYLDNTIREMYVAGGIDIFIHKYLGPKELAASGDATLPSYNESNPLFIEDLLLLENRNRKYEPDIYTQRGVYRVQDIDFDLSQFGLFLQNDTLFITFHYNDMIDQFGRKLMNGDVLEIPNLKDYHPLDTSIPKALPKFYVVNDASFASEGFSATWLPHLWRVKAVPLVGSQEYSDILNRYADTQGGIDGDDGLGNGSGTLADYICQHNKNIAINDATLTQAAAEVPLSGYDSNSFYVTSYNANGDPLETVYQLTQFNASGLTADIIEITADNALFTADETELPSSTYDGEDLRFIINKETVDANLADTAYTTVIEGYLIGDGEPADGYPVTPGVSFPVNPAAGDYSLRLDYAPNRLFRFNGNMWVHIEDNVRTQIYLNGETQRSRFINNTDTITTDDQGVVLSKQTLSNLLKPKSDN